MSPCGELAMKSVDVETLILDITATYPTLQAKTAEISIDKRIPRVLANEAALSQIVSNFLDNAVKFVAPGVRPRVDVHAEANGDFVRLWFKDNGIGIPTHQLEKLFNLFVRLKQPEHYEGTGIGLAIVRKAATRMGGSVGVESEDGAGSRFWVQLKKAPP